jgi:hypothetical protein
VVNGLYPELAGIGAEPAKAAAAADVVLRPGEAALLAGAADFRRRRTALHDEQVDRLAEQLPLPQLRLPFMFTAAIGPAEVDVLARELLADIEALTELPT